jgi:nucleotide-binding universal stress UspA family protein
MKREFETELVLDRPEALASTYRAPDSGIKTILFHVHDDDRVMDRLQAVIGMARACGAHIHCLHVTPLEAYTVVDVIGGAFVNADIMNAFEAEAERLRQRIEGQLKIEDVAWDYEEVTGEIMARLVRAAALADVLVTGREPHQREFGGPAVTLIGDLLAQVRTPILILPEGSSTFDPLAPAVIGWNASCEAANAARAAVPLLKLARKVTVMRITEERDRRFPSTSLLEFLSRHGIRAELETRTTSGDVEGALLRHAVAEGAGLLVIGGYSHSRAGEFLFGGVTRALIEDSPIALLIAR